MSQTPSLVAGETVAMPVDIAPAVEQVLELALSRSIDALVDCAIEAPGPDGAELTWGSWLLSAEGEAVSMTGGRSDLYAGDAGVAHTLRRLADGLGRADLGLLADRADATLRRRSDLRTVGWLSGTAGLASVAGSPDWSAGDAASLDATDLTGGVAGVLLTLARRGATTAEARPFVRELGRRATRAAWGAAWTDPTETGDAARPLCGLAHGASGIVWALAEAARTWPELADEALALADDGLRWESAWFDPIRGGWPDLRDGVTWPALWCHGAAGGGAVRLRLLELLDAGMPSPWPRDTLLAEAEVAVQACGSAVAQALDGLAAGVVPHAGLTICHGLGGPLLLLVEASRVLGAGAESHLEFAREATVRVLDAFDDDPTLWPSGFRGADGDLGLLSGVAGTALVLGASTRPEAFPGTALLG